MSGRPDPIEKIRQLYFAATPETIQGDFERAIDLLKAIPDPASRERAAVYMEGLAEMRKEFGAAARRRRPRRERGRGR